MTIKTPPIFPRLEQSTIALLWRQGFKAGEMAAQGKSFCGYCELTNSDELNTWLAGYETSLRKSNMINFRS